MTNPLEDKTLTRDKLRQLIELANTHVTPEQTQADAEDYDWQQPHRFSPDNLIALDAFVKRIAEHVAKTFDALCQGDFEVAVTSTSQHFVRTIAQMVSTEQPEHYFLPFATTDNKHCGFISISPESAPVLVGHMLRDADIGAREDKKLSELEETILTDITAAAIDAFADALKNNAGPVIQRTSQIVKGKWPLDFNEFENMTSIALTVNHPDGNAEIVFTVLCETIEPALGIKPQLKQQLTTEGTRNMIMRHMYEAPINVTAQFGSASMALGNVMNLSVGDVLLLEKKIDEPIDVLLNDRTCFRGYPAASFGKYAVVIE
jgi:flagellar motor switch protein FliM